jgi:hypothetical protein
MSPIPAEECSMRSRLLPVPAVVAAVAAAGHLTPGRPMRATYGAAVPPEAPDAEPDPDRESTDPVDTVALCGW